jgi:hypothetical protein
MRCRNCGSPKHHTQNCEKYGPWYPFPGKTKEDYQEITDWINTLVAADVLAEHEADHGHQEEVIPEPANYAEQHTLDDLKELLRVESIFDDLEPL